MKSFLYWVLATLMLMSGFGAFAADTAAPAVELMAYKVIAPAKAGMPEKFEPAERALPGDTIEYRATYRGAAQEPSRNVQVVVPVPGASVEYQINSSVPQGIEASTDGKLFHTVPLMRTETLPNGKQVRRPAPATDYRFLRWNLGDLPAGASRTVRARVQVVNNAVPAR